MSKFLVFILGCLVAFSMTAQSTIVAMEYYFDEDPGFGLGTSIAIVAGTELDISESLDISLLSEGVHTLHIRARNAANRWSLLEARRFTIRAASEAASGPPAQITDVEYYIDEDPGVGLGTAISVSSSNELDLSESIDVSALAVGDHTITVRARNSENRWSVLEARKFSVRSPSEASAAAVDISAVEYYFDEDPGIGNAISIPVGSGSELDIEESLDISTLGVGPHVLHIRARDAIGKWSLLESRRFIIRSPAETANPNGNVVAMEYYFDEDPGIGLGTAIPVSEASELDITASLDVNALSSGPHTVHVRAQNVSGKWSLVESRRFIVRPSSESVNATAPITRLEYFISQAGWVGEVSTYELPTPSALLDEMELRIPLSDELLEGRYFLHVRAQNTDGEWGLYEVDTLDASRPAGLNVPTDVIAYRSGENVTLEWTDNSTTETGYAIYRSNSYEDFDQAALVVDGVSLPSDATSVTFPEDANRRFYQVQATNNEGYLRSSIEHATTLDFPGQGLEFDGLDDHVAIADHEDLQFNGDFTAEAWFYFDGSDQRGVILSKREDMSPWQQWYIAVGDGIINGGEGKRLFADILPGNRTGAGSGYAVVDRHTSATVDLTAGWHHVAMVQDYDQALTLYLDGTVVATATNDHGGGETAVTGFPVYIGVASESLVPYDGQIEEVRLWKDSVKTDFSDRFSPLRGDENHLVAYYAMDESSGNKLVDRSRNTHDGNIVGALFTPADRMAPVVTVDQLSTTSRSPQIAGSVDDNTATIEVTINGNTYNAINNNDDTWILPSDVITPPLDAGVYEVVVTATDIFQNRGTDATSDELNVVGSQPVLAVLDEETGSLASIASGQSEVVDFGVAEESNNLLRTFTIINTEPAEQVISSITSSDAVFVIDNAATTIPASGFSTFSIVLPGTTPGTFTSQISLVFNDAVAEPFVFSIRGEIAATVPVPEIALFSGSDNSGTMISNNQVIAIDFGSAVEGTEISRSFTIENTGSADLVINEITSSESDFEVTSAITIVAPATSGVFTVSLTGSSQGTFSSIIEITSNDSDQNPFVFPIVGEITATPSPEIAVFAGADNTATPINAGQTTAINFGTGEAGTSISRTFSIENIGSSDLTVVSITSNEASFAVTDGIESVSPGATVTFDVTLSGLAAGSFNANITILSDDADEGIFTFPVVGEMVSPGTAPEIEVYLGQDNSGSPLISQGFVDVGNTLRGSDAVIDFTLENPGTGELVISGIASSDPAFTVSSTVNSVAPGSLTGWTLTLNASEGGDYSSLITIASNDADEGFFQFIVTGTVDLEEITLTNKETGAMVMSNSIFNLGSTAVGEPIIQLFEVFNSSANEELQISAVDTGSDEVSLVKSPTSIAAGESEDLEIQFNAREAGIVSTSIEITSNFATFVIQITGEAAPRNRSIQVYNVVTPNNDGRHDFLKIDRITEHPDNQVLLFNRSGALVFQASGYDNEDVRFEGMGNQGGNGRLEAGTYYYVIQLSSGAKESGFIQLIRN